MEESRQRRAIELLHKDFLRLGFTPFDPKPDLFRNTVPEGKYPGLDEVGRVAVCRALIKVDLGINAAEVYDLGTETVKPRYPLMEPWRTGDETFSLHQHDRGLFKCYLSAASYWFVLIELGRLAGLSEAEEWSTALDRLIDLNRTRLLEPLARLDKACGLDGLASALSMRGTDAEYLAPAVLVNELLDSGRFSPEKFDDALERTFTRGWRKRDADNSKGNKNFPVEEWGHLSAAGRWTILRFLEDQVKEDPAYFSTFKGGSIVPDHWRVKTALEEHLGEPVSAMRRIDKKKAVEDISSRDDFEGEVEARDTLERAVASIRNNYQPGECKRVIIDNLVALTEGRTTAHEIADRHGFTRETVRVNLGFIRNRVEKVVRASHCPE